MRGNGGGSAPVTTGSNYHGLSNANGNIGFARRNSYIAGGQPVVQQDPQAVNVPPVTPTGVRKDLPNMRLRPNAATSGWTAWGIITLIVCVIILGFCGYYGIICYPLFFDKGNRYDHMDGNSTTTTTSSPTRSPDFGKMDYEEEEFRGYPKLSTEKGGPQWATAN